MWPQHSKNAQDLVVVLDGDEKQADELAPNYPEFELISDPEGDIADRFGIQIWPTIIAVDGGAIVTGVRQGLYEFDEPAVVSDQMDRSPVDSPATHGDGS
jgi:thioredoxin-like negative regulator of GroEL